MPMCLASSFRQWRQEVGTSIQHVMIVTSCVPAVRDLAPPGDLTSLQTFSFEFNDVEMQYDSYKGLQVRLRCASS